MPLQEGSAGEIELRRMAEVPGWAEELLDDFVRTEVGHWGEALPEMVQPLREAIQSNQVAGRVAGRDGRPLGMIACSERDGIGTIQFIHVLSTCQEEDVPARLVQQTVDDLRQAGARRITCEAPVAAHQETIRRTFTGLEFQVIDRMVMSLELREQPAVLPLPEGYELTGWDDRHIEGVTQVVHDANLGTLDQLIYPDLGTISGTGRMLQLIRMGAAGPLDEEASVIALHAGVPCGVVLFARPAAERGFIAEMAVVKARQGQGLGRILLNRALAVAYGRGMRVVHLGVTERNQPALTLYRQLGFTPGQRITAYVWEKGA